MNDHYRYDYIYFIHEKAQLLDMFKIIRLKLKINLPKRLKMLDSIVRGEYYGRFDGTGEQCPWR